MTTATQEIAKTIIAQIKGTDFWSLARWAAREYVAMPEGDNGEGIGKVQGGVRFKVSRTNNVKQSGYVFVFLTWDDTYIVKVVKVRNYDIKILKIVEGVYCDNLCEVIDNILDGKSE